VDDLGGIRGARPTQGSAFKRRSAPCAWQHRIVRCSRSCYQPRPWSGEDALGDGEGDTDAAFFTWENRHQIKDAPPNTWATVDCRDVVTMSELARARVFTSLI